MTDILLPFDNGTSQGSWLLVGGTSIADIVDLNDSDASYVWIDGATVGNYFDLKLDEVSGEVDGDDPGDVTLRFRCRALTNEKTCELAISIYEGDPNDGGSLIGDRKQNLSETVWEEITASFDWGVVQASVTDFDNLYLRLEITKLTGGGGAPSPAVSLVQVELPGTINKSAASIQRIEPVIGQRYNIHLWPIGGERVRKADFKLSATGEGNFYRRNGELIPSLTVRDFEVPE